MIKPPQRALRIGTRGSALALAQVRLVVARLKSAHAGLPEPEVVVIKTTGDRVQDRPLAELGGKGLFAKEIEQALLADTIDCAVHSLKDLETHLPPGLVIGAVLPRADPRDALIAPAARSLADLPAGASVATGSIRRAAQLRALRPDLAIGPLRGNVDTRLAKIRGGAAAATLLAVAGLERLGLSVPEATPLDPDVFLPAPGQGLVAIECRDRDGRVRELLAACGDAASAAAMAAERALLAGLDGSCKTPIGALATALPGGALRLRALLARADGTLILHAERVGTPGDAAAMGADAAADLRARAPADLLAA
ncbi:MAG: hydroxymethylbilane synthase [Alphaproteobacteria bacterium]